MPPVTTFDSPATVVDKPTDSVTNGDVPNIPQKPVIGIIYPPPEIRNIVDKTANFVARNGIEFESRIKQNEANNSKFNFLRPGDPYHAYYQHKVKEFQEGKNEDLQSISSQQAKTVAPPKVQDAVRAVEKLELKEPPPEFEFAVDPATINSFELDLIKLTAQFVARNGKNFLSQLLNREARNPQFDFLKPAHSNFAYFTRLVEQYTKIILPSRDILKKLDREFNYKHILGNVKYRVDWEKQQQRLKEKEEAEAERERVAYAQVDWHDFVVVQTVDFQPGEMLNLPPPCKPQDVGARILAQQRADSLRTGNVGTTALVVHTEMDVESDEEEVDDINNDVGNVQVVQDLQLGSGAHEAMKATASSIQIELKTSGGVSVLNPSVAQSSLASGGRFVQPIPAAPRPDEVIVRRDYNPRQRQIEKPKEEKWVISPLTGERIPADKLDEHLRYNTIDQQYFEQKERERAEKLDDEPVFAPGMDISANIKEFASRRTDIFGIGAEQTMIGKKIGEESSESIRDPKAIWDGHTSSIEAVAKAAQAAISLEQQIQQIHKAKGLLPDDGKDKIGPTVSAGISTASTMQSSGPPEIPTLPQAHIIVAARPAASALSIPSAATVIAAPRAQVMPMIPMPQQVMLISQPSAMAIPAVPILPSFHHASVAAAAINMPSMPDILSSMAAANAMDDDEPLNKRQRTEEQLVPEAEWMRTHPSPIAIQILVPNVSDKPEWKLNGQIFTCSIHLNDPVSVIKAKIQENTNMPASKQKLLYDCIFIKDSNSLAYYNLDNGSTIQLQLKERGGRKK